MKDKLSPHIISNKNKFLLATNHDEVKTDRDQA
jgi:hypothetical protein